ncbi:TIGR01244 family sulfur transferase [Sphingomonas sp.]|uniref:TIGR01244 family sulfur transferase n=1 Tax=Sphingomonas sp. TaxID=28214 RepID=UPI003B004D2A
MFRTIDETLFVAGQITPEDVAEAARLGIRTIVNNRPDGEEPGQPTGAEIEAAARAAGLEYVAIPVDHAGLSMAQVEATRAALAKPGPTLAYCRSGTRSTNLWAATRALDGGDKGEIAANAGNAGYDVRGLLASIG